MKKALPRLLAEFLWLVLSVLVTRSVELLLFGQSSTDGNLDLHVHDTYFVISKWVILTPIFLLATFIIYLIKSRLPKFKTLFNYWVIVGSGILLILSITLLIKHLSQLGAGSTALYPPLSGLGPHKMMAFKPEQLVTLTTSLLSIVQAVILGITIAISYRWGTKKVS